MPDTSADENKCARHTSSRRIHLETRTVLIFKFAGNLRRFYRQISLNVDTPAQGLRLLLAQDFEFKKAFLNTKLRCG
jgi:hypothetical protein